MRCYWWVSRTQALRPLACHLAGQHGSAAPHTGSSTVPLQREPGTQGLSLPTLPEMCAGEKELLLQEGEEGLDVQARASSTRPQHEAAPPTSRQPGLHAVNGSSTPVHQGPRATVLWKGRSWAGGRGVWWGSDKSLSQEVELWAGLGMGA